MALVGDGELAVTQGVPELDRSVTGTRDDLTVVSGEGNGEDIVGVADEGAGGVSGGELPQTQSLVPRSGQSVGTVRGDDLVRSAKDPSNSVQKLLFETYTVGDDVGVTLQAALGVAVGLLIAGEVPDDQGLVARSGEQHVGAITAVRIPFLRFLRRSYISLLLERGRQAGNPAIVALEGSAVDQLLSHDRSQEMKKEPRDG